MKRFVCGVIGMCNRLKIFGNHFFALVNVIALCRILYFPHTFLDFLVRIEQIFSERFCFYAFDCVSDKLCQRIVKSPLTVVVGNLTAERNALPDMSAHIDCALYIRIVSPECLVLPKDSLCQSLFQKTRENEHQ